MIEYAGWYVFVGAAYYGLFYALVGRKRSRPDSDLWAGFVAGITGDKPLGDKLLSGLLAPFAAVVIFLAIWPWVLWASIAELSKGNDETANRDKAREFAVLDGFLVCELPLADIELRETVEDPMGAAPKLPFGHLNSAWEEFKAVSGNGAFWKFSGKHVGDWGGEWLREGYAVLKEDGTRPYFLSRQEYLGRN